METPLIVAFITLAGSLVSVSVTEFFKEKHRRAELLMKKSEEALVSLAKFRVCCQRQFEMFNDYVLLEEGNRSDFTDFGNKCHSLNTELRRFTCIYFPDSDPARSSMYRNYQNLQLEYSKILENLEPTPKDEKPELYSAIKNLHENFNALILSCSVTENSLISSAPKWQSKPFD